MRRVVVTGMGIVCPLGLGVEKRQIGLGVAINTVIGHGAAIAHQPGALFGQAGDIDLQCLGVRRFSQCPL